jgi:hypothetical protein
VDEEDDSFDSSSASDGDSDRSIAGDDSDGDNVNPYADGTLFLPGMLSVDFGDDGRSVVSNGSTRTGITGSTRTGVTGRSERTGGTGGTKSSRRAKDVCAFNVVMVG